MIVRSPAAAETPTCAYLQPDDPRAEFAQQCADLKQRLEYAALPGIDIAMHPNEFTPRDDVSDESIFNNRFIEPQWQRAGSFLAQIGGGAITLSLLVCFVLGPLIEKELRLQNLVIVPFACLFAWMCIGLAGSGERMRKRYNRQAQLVHFFDGKVLVNLPWRDVFPAVNLGSNYAPCLFFPIPYTQLEHRKESIIRSAFRHGFEVSGEFDWRDHLFMWNCLERLEFIRHYMESGIRSVQADDELIRSGIARKPTGRDTSGERLKSMGPFSRYVMYPIHFVCYWFSGAPLIDRWLDTKASQFRWPEEVERLCAPGADLSAYDTRPVRSKTTIYYRYDGMDKGIVLVDREGSPLR